MTPQSKNINKNYENRDISTISPLLKSTWVSEEAKNIKEFKFVGLIHYFSTKNWINFEKPSKKCWFLCTFTVFQEFFNPGWKVADQTQKFEFLEVFRFFWHQCCQQEWRNSGWKESWAKIPVCKSSKVSKAICRA